MKKLLLSLILVLNIPFFVWGAPAEVEAQFIRQAPRYMDVFRGERKRTFIDTLDAKIEYARDMSAQERRATILMAKEMKSPTSSQILLETYADYLFQHDVPAGVLTKMEIVALRSYMEEDFLMINSELRKPQPSKAALIHAEMINSALDKLPPFVGLTMRGVKLPASLVQQMYAGNIVEMKGFTSTSADLDLDTFMRKHRLIIHSKTGRDISAYADLKFEQEVLFKPNMKFKVLSAKLVGTHEELESNTEIEFELEEI
jgi:hypothetical protein